MVHLAREISNKTSPPLIIEKLLSSVETTLLTDLTFMIDTTVNKKVKCISYYNIIPIKNSILKCDNFRIEL